MSEEYKGVVDRIVSGGKHGPYAVISSEKLGFVTMALCHPIWSEERWPELGTYVMFSRVTKKRAGWRTEQGRFYKPSDEEKEKRA